MTLPILKKKSLPPHPCHVMKMRAVPQELVNGDECVVDDLELFDDDTEKVATTQVFKKRVLTSTLSSAPTTKSAGREVVRLSCCIAKDLHLRLKLESVKKQQSIHRLLETLIAEHISQV